MRLPLALGGLLLAGGLGLGIPALWAHHEARSAWSAERAQLGTADYDPRASDRSYTASRDAWRRSGLAGHLLGAGLLLFTLGAVRRRTATSTRAEPPRARVIGASLIDGGLGLAILALTLVDAGESAALRALEGAAPWLAALPSAPLSAGTSAGLRAFGLQVSPGLRGVVAMILWPLALLAPLGTLLPPLAAAHLRVAGLIPRRA